jgi:DHA1 family tetracycline resistance protein-like MFS transporter
MFMLYFARILDGLTGGNITTAQAYVSDITADEDRAQGLGMLQGAFGVGFIFGPAFGGLLGNFGPLVPFIGAAIITTGTLLLTTFTLKESLPPEERTDRSSADQRGLPLHLLLQEKSLTTILAIAFFATLAFAAFPAVFSLYADKVLLTNVPPNRVQISIGLMLTYHGLVMVVTQFALLRPLVKRFGERRLILMGDIALAASMFVVAPITDPILATALFTPLAFGQGITLPSLQALMTRFGNRQMGGRLLGLYQSARSLALIFGPVWAGYVFQQIRPQMVFVVGSVLCVIAALLALLLLRMDLPITRVQPQSASQQAATD